MNKLLLSCALALFATTASAQDPVPTPTPFGGGYSFAALFGPTVSMGASTETAVTPQAFVSVSGPIPIGSIAQDRLPVLHVIGNLSALPGDEIDREGGISATLKAFKSIEFSVGISKRISNWLVIGSQELATSVFVEAGFATRLDGDTVPRDKAPRWASVGLRFDDRKSGAYLKNAVALDQRLDGKYQLAMNISGYVKAYEFKSGSAGAEVGLLMRAILGIDASKRYPELTGGRRDVVTVSSVFGW